MIRAFMLALCAMAICFPAPAQTTDQSALADAAVADLRATISAARSDVLIPSPYQQVTLYSSVRPAWSQGETGVQLCSATALYFDYTRAPEGPPSQALPGQTIANISAARVYRVADNGPDNAEAAQARCEANAASARWFGVGGSRSWDASRTIDLVDTTLGLQRALNAGDNSYKGFSLSDLHGAPADIHAFRNESAARLAQVNQNDCAATDRAWCDTATVQFGGCGPITYLDLTFSTPRAQPVVRRLVAAAVRTGGCVN
ncbi:MAG TPA: hypothetical protein VG943_03600 [Caulobacterales bacterium]|nr:hypothetical protein [Caulobacterales bacterium]